MIESKALYFHLPLLHLPHQQVLHFKNRGGGCGGGDKSYFAMSNTDFLGRAIDVVKKAIENDTAGEYEKAYQLYYQALELFMLALKWEKNVKTKEMIRGKAGEYMERAEKLKTHLAEADKGNRKKPAAVGSNGKVLGGGGKGK